MKIYPETFEATGTYTVPQARGFSYEVGTAQIEVGGNSYTVPAKRFKDGDVAVAGFVGQYRTGSKLWPCFTCYSQKTKGVHLSFGRDERSGRCQQSGARFDIDLYWSVVGEKAKERWGVNS